MTTFTLDPRLAADCIVLGDMPLSRLLLMNNDFLPWFILVPRRQTTELFHLDQDDQLLLLDEVNHLSRLVKRHFPVEKLNVAAIGNIVRQLHIHVVGRSATDICWPGVVWGIQERQPYQAERIHELQTLVRTTLPGDMFKPL